MKLVVKHDHVSRSAESGCIIPRDDSSDIDVIPNKDSYLTGDRVKFSCPNGFLLSSSAEQICLSNSTWSGEQPHCVVDPESQEEGKLHGCLSVLKAMERVFSLIWQNLPILIILLFYSRNKLMLFLSICFCIQYMYSLSS